MAFFQCVNLFPRRFERRASQDCVGYQPPGGATVFGDPHVYTFDGLPYTFNGKGEFVLVRYINRIVTKWFDPFFM